MKAFWLPQSEDVITTKYDRNKDLYNFTLWLYFQKLGDNGIVKLPRTKLEKVT